MIRPPTINPGHVHRGHYSNSKTKASSRQQRQQAANIWERDFCKKSFNGSSSRNLSQMRLQQQKKGIRDFYENHYQQQQAIYICAISNDATAAAINRWTGLGKPIFPFNFHSSIFPQHQQQQFLQRESMPKPPLINNIDLILFCKFS